MTTGLRSARFGKVELSDPRFEPDHLRFMTFNSPALGGRGDVTLYQPSHTPMATELPIVVLLHGVYGSHWAWAYKAGAHRIADDLITSGQIPPLVIVMPSDGLWAEGSGYLPHVTTDYETWVVDDVLGCVRECVPQVGAQSPIFISGLSMGGYAALRLGAKYPQIFKGVAAHSAFNTLEIQRSLVTQSLPFQPGDRDDGSVLFWMLEHRAQLPPMRFDCGTEDKFLEHNRALSHALHAADILHRYEEYPGGHDWTYWSERLPTTLRFFADILASAELSMRPQTSEAS